MKKVLGITIIIWGIVLMVASIGLGVVAASELLLPEQSLTRVFFDGIGNLPKENTQVISGTVNLLLNFGGLVLTFAALTVTIWAPPFAIGMLLIVVGGVLYQKKK